MKLAEVLILRKSEKNNLAFLEGRLKANAKVQEGETPQEWPVEILQKIEESIQKIENYTRIINHANQTTVWKDGTFGVLADALARRDSLAKQRRIYTETLGASTVKEPRFGRMEIKYTPVIEAKYLLAMIEKTTKEFGELETKIQQLNWTKEV